MHHFVSWLPVAPLDTSLQHPQGMASTEDCVFWVVRSIGPLLVNFWKRIPTPEVGTCLAVATRCLAWLVLCKTKHQSCLKKPWDQRHSERHYGLYWRTQNNHAAPRLQVASSSMVSLTKTRIKLCPAIIFKAILRRCFAHFFGSNWPAWWLNLFLKQLNFVGGSIVQDCSRVILLCRKTRAVREHSFPFWESHCF